MQRPVTEDSVYRSSIKILQPVSGYRFAVDAVLLAHFLKTNVSEVLLEVGAGSGVITILLSVLQQYHSVVAVEVQSELATLCKTNLQRNHVNCATVYAVDIKELENFIPPQTFDLIYSNPPYRKMGSGKLNPSTQKAIARHEVLMNLGDLFHCAEFFLKPSGRMSMILPGFREKDFYFHANRHQFHLQSRQYVHSFGDEPPEFVMATVSKSFTAFDELPSIVIYKEPGTYTEEMNLLLTDTNFV